MKRYSLEITVQGPVLFQSSTIGAYGLDSVVARLPDGTPYLADSHVTGKLREAVAVLEDISNSEGVTDLAFDCQAWFGSVDEGQGQKRKMVHLSDLIAAHEGERGQVKTVTAINPLTGTALDSALQVLETPYAPGEQVIFTGELRILAPDTEVDKIAKALRAGLNWITQMGSRRTTGFGRILGVKLDEKAVGNDAVFSEGAGQEVSRWQCVLTFSEPFCVTRGQPDQNTFESVDRIPGSVIKGAVATQAILGAGGRPGESLSSVLKDTELGKNFNDLIVSHFFPANKDAQRRPETWPLSLVKYAGNDITDVLLDEQQAPFLDTEKNAPAFSTDWKFESYSKVGEAYGWSSPRKDVRVRTAIDSQTRSAKDEHLFAYEMIIPDGHIWMGYITLPDGANKMEMRAELERLLGNGLSGIGKSNALASLELRPAKPCSDLSSLALDKEVRITLQTAALLLLPDACRETSGSEQVFEGYRDAFCELSGDSLELKKGRYFAEQSLSGGSFIKARSGSVAYLPWLLTSAGSVFEFEVKNAEKAQDVLGKWQCAGLPVPDDVWQAWELAESDERWKKCNYIPENGFGEIIVNQQFPEGLKGT